MCGAQWSRRRPKEGGAQDWSRNEGGSGGVSKREWIGCHCAKCGRSYRSGQETGGQIFCQLLLESQFGLQKRKKGMQVMPEDTEQRSVQEEFTYSINDSRLLRQNYVTSKHLLTNMV